MGSEAGDGSPRDTQLTLRWLATERVLWNAVVESLNVGKYEQAAILLKEAQQTAKEDGELVQARLLGATRELCLTASQNALEIEGHRRAYKEGVTLDSQLRAQLRSIFELSSQQEMPGAEEALPDFPSIDLKAAGRQKPVTEENLSLWQRIKRKFRGESTATSPRYEESALSAQTPAPHSLRELSQLPAGSPTPSQSIEQESSEASARKPDSLSEEQIATADRPEAQVEQVPRRPPSLVVYCLGRFQVYQDEIPVEDWLSSKGNSIFKYLATHRENPVAKEVLMELFWPEADPDSARNSLNVAIYSLRQCLRGTRPDFSHILFRGGAYLLNPELQIWVDSEEFMSRFATAHKLEESGTLNLAIREYHAAEALYQGEFLEEDRYEDWILPHRQNLQDSYLRLLEHLSSIFIRQDNYEACSTTCRKILAVDPCLEEAHRRLMRCYDGQGQRYLALRQYHLCVEALSRELDIDPSQATRELYNRIRK